MPQTALQSQSHRKRQGTDECQNGRDFKAKNARNDQKKHKTQANIHHRSEKWANRGINISSRKRGICNRIELTNNPQTDPQKNESKQHFRNKNDAPIHRHLEVSLKIVH